MKKFKKGLKRVAAVALSVLMLANTVELPVLTVHAEETTANVLLGNVTAASWVDWDAHLLQTALPGTTGETKSESSSVTNSQTTDGTGLTYESFTGTQIGVSIEGSDSSATYTYDGSGWTADGSGLSWPAEGSGSLLAYYPADSSYDSFTIPDDQSTEELLAAADWMTAKTDFTSTPTDYTSDFAFQHNLAKVTIIINTWNSEFLDTAQEVNEPKIYSNCGTVITPYDESSNLYPKFTAMVAPGTYDAEDVFFSSIINYETDRIVLANDNYFLTNGLEAGKHYTFYLTVGEDKIEIDSVTVTEWETVRLNEVEYVYPWNSSPTSMGVTVTDSDADSINELFEQSNVKFNISDGDGKFVLEDDGTMPVLFDRSGQQTISAYAAPYAEGGMPETISLPNDYTSNDTDAYNYYISEPANVTDYRVALTMQPLLSSLYITIGEPPTGTTITKVELLDVVYSANLDGTTLTAITEAKDTTTTTTKDITMREVYDGEYLALLIPTAYEDGITVKVTLNDDSTYTETIPAVTLVGGTAYGYKTSDCLFGHTSGTYALGEDTTSITDVCSVCGVTIGTATISATNKSYDGNAYTAIVTKTGTLKESEIPVTYTAAEGSTLTDDKPVNVGTYTASITLGEGENAVTATVEFEIGKATLDLGKVTSNAMTDTLELSDVVLSYQNQPLAGTLALAEDTVLKYGTHTYNWVFTPTDTTNYNQATGTVEITIYDTIAPVISGVTDGETYCEAQTITVTDENTLTVTINDNPVELTNGTYELAATGEQYVIVATDGMNNSKTVTVTVGHVDADSDGYCDNCDTFADGIGANLAGYTISLNGNIGVNFYMELDREVVGDTGAYMLFTLPNGDTNQVSVADATQNTTLVEGKTYYIFSCEVASYEMAQSIKAQMFDGNGNGGKEYSYTVRDYAEYIINNEANYTSDDVAFAKAMLNYGACSQTYFEVETDNLANKNLDTADQTVATLTASDLEAYKVSATSNELGTFAGYSLTLKSETTLKAYFKLAEGVDVSNLTFTANGQTVTPAKSGDYYVLSLENIKAWDLDTSYAFKVSNGSVELEFSCSALSYGYSVLNKGNSTYPDTLIQLISALRVYQQKSEVYVSGNN